MSEGLRHAATALIASKRGQRDGDIRVVIVGMDEFDALRTALAADGGESARHLQNLCAVIFGDGGHRYDDIGDAEQATEEAIAKVIKLQNGVAMQELDDAWVKSEGLKRAAEAISRNVVYEGLEWRHGWKEAVRVEWIPKQLMETLRAALAAEGSERERDAYPMVQVCRKCGRKTTDSPRSKYCGDGSDKDNAHDWEPVDPALKLIFEIDRTLRVPAAEYVPAISDVFQLIDDFRVRRAAALAADGGGRESENTRQLVAMMREREQRGIGKYGTTCDRTDLSFNDWAQHAIEEMLDGAAYLNALKRTATPSPAAPGEEGT